jgi:hypothetical protein
MRPLSRWEQLFMILKLLKVFAVIGFRLTEHLIFNLAQLLNTHLRVESS